VDYPAIREAHAAGVFDTGEEVAAWGGALAPHLAVAGTEPAVWLAPAAADAARQPIEAAILRRGSSRAFAPEPIPAAALATVLWSATRGIAADFVRPGAPLADLYLIVNAVDGVAPGAYVFDRTRCALALLQRGEFRRLAGHLGLDQSLPAEAAVDVFWLTDLGPVLERFGNRGYRAAQLEAAIEGGKAYLTAYVLGLGATGLTFFDDEVTAFLSPHAAGKSVMFLVALGRARRARA
jgi:nitroreductase